MKTTTILKLTTLSLMLLFTNNSWAKEITNGKPIIDDAHGKKDKEDTPKGGDGLKDEYRDKNISLSTLKSSYHIQRKDLLFPPYRCFIYHADDKQTEISTSNSTTIDFTINKSLLTVGDIILVTNSIDVESINSVKKLVIEEISIRK